MERIKTLNYKPKKVGYGFAPIATDKPNSKAV
jgi:hypothetical protein